VQKTVAEGQSATWRVSLSSRTDYSVEVLAQPVHGKVSVPRLTKGDVSPAWIDRHASQSGPDSTPLEKLGIYVFDSVRAGERFVDVTVPVRKDGAREGREAITLRFRFGDRTVSRTIYVASST
jgi:hypothetical protein